MVHCCNSSGLVFMARSTYNVAEWTIELNFVALECECHKVQ